MAPFAHPLQRNHSVFDQDQCTNLRRVVEVMSRASDDGGRGVSSNLGHPVWWPFFFPPLLVFEQAMVLRGRGPCAFRPPQFTGRYWLATAEALSIPDR
jgi:hypothetical protein